MTMPITRPITDFVEQIVDREEWFGEDAHGNLIRFMMASTYAMNQFHEMYGKNANLFVEGPCRNIVTALFENYEQTGRVVAINPGRKTRIQMILDSFVAKIKDPSELDRTIDRFNNYLEEVKPNLHYYGNKRDANAIIQQSRMLFSHARAEKLVQELITIDNTVENPVDFAKAVDAQIEKYRELPTLTFNGVKTNNISALREMVQRAFNEVNEPIFTLPERYGPIATMMNPQFVPSGFISFMGPEKRGKSWWLQEIAIHAAKRVPTLYIQAGDMSTEMVIRRMVTRFLKRSYKEQYCGELFVPVLDCYHNRKNKCNRPRRCNHKGVEMPTNDTPRDWLEKNPDYIPCAECARCGDKAWKPIHWWKLRNPVEPFNVDEACDIFEKMQNGWNGFLDIRAYSSNTLTVSMIRKIVHSGIISGEKYGAVILDYMDLLGSEKGNSRDYRHFQNELWKDFRGMLQDYDLCGIVATQANITAQDCEYIDMNQISEDKRKASHVTAMWGLNQTKEEKQEGIMRVNQVVVRDDEFDTRQQIAVLQCLAIGQPILGSYIIPNYAE